jgi:hypothetical protein
MGVTMEQHRVFIMLQQRQKYTALFTGTKAPAIDAAGISTVLRWKKVFKNKAPFIPVCFQCFVKPLQKFCGKHTVIRVAVTATHDEHIITMSERVIQRLSGIVFQKSVAHSAVKFMISGNRIYRNS